MSLEVFLIPLGIVAATAIKQAVTAKKDARAAEQNSIEVEEQHFESTRIQDQDLLIEGLEAIGVTNISRRDRLVTGSYQNKDVNFVWHSDRYIAQVVGSREATQDLAFYLDGAVGKILQKRSVEAIQAQAQNMGMRLIERQNLDGTIQMVFEEQ